MYKNKIYRKQNKKKRNKKNCIKILRKYPPTKIKTTTTTTTIGMSQSVATIQCL